MSQDDFEPPDSAFKVLIDYPWDEPSHAIDEDRIRATNARKKKGTLYTVCWLPRHLSPSELGVLTELAAVRYLLSDAGQEDLLETLGPQDKGKILDQAGIREKTLKGQLDDLMKEVYVRHGEFLALISGVDGSWPRETLTENLEHIATLLMDRRYPQHPNFLAEPKKADLEVLLGWMVQAGETNVSVAYDETTGKVLRTLGQPLELANLGQTKASLRLDSRYIKDVLARVDQDSVAWAPIAEHLRDDYGLQSAVVDLFLCFVCQRDHRALHELDGEPVEVRIGMPPAVRIRLQRGKLVSAADWHRLRDLGNHLFNEPRPPAHRSLQGQDKFCATLKKSGQSKRTVLQGIHQRLVNLDAEGDRIKEIATANTRLGALALTTTDSHKVVSELLVAWPDDASDALRGLVQQAEVIRDALGEVNEHTRKSLTAGANHAVVGVEVREHLSSLEVRLAAPQSDQPLTKDWVQTWNMKAQQLILKLIEQPAPPPVQPPRPPAACRAVLLKSRISVGDPDAVSRFLAQVRKVLADEGDKNINVALVREEDHE